MSENWPGFWLGLILSGLGRGWVCIIGCSGGIPTIVRLIAADPDSCLSAITKIDLLATEIAVYPMQWSALHQWVCAIPVHPKDFSRI